ncbi:hypothetical protein IFM89_025268 [Coptis chinensis]|uniref:Uncharacterized protein n=1 Tax=Coptis chinensis TaxID=261450 RepID=A0A835GY01_9MAGN|nr:hypothetical protein IFM89_025268 [Coptis chinensis]
MRFSALFDLFVVSNGASRTRSFAEVATNGAEGSLHTQAHSKNRVERSGGQAQDLNGLYVPDTFSGIMDKVTTGPNSNQGSPPPTQFRMRSLVVCSNNPNQELVHDTATEGRSAESDRIVEDDEGDWDRRVRWRMTVLRMKSFSLNHYRLRMVRLDQLMFLTWMRRNYLISGLMIQWFRWEQYYAGDKLKGINHRAGKELHVLMKNKEKRTCVDFIPYTGNFGSGKPGFVFNKKLKHLKMKLREWNREKFGRFDLKIKDYQKILGELEQKEEQVDLSSQELDLKEETKRNLQHQLNLEETYWFSRAKTKWNKEGERCTDYSTGLLMLAFIAIPFPN